MVQQCPWLHSKLLRSAPWFGLVSVGHNCWTVCNSKQTIRLHTSTSCSTDVVAAHSWQQDYSGYLLVGEILRRDEVCCKRCDSCLVYLALVNDERLQQHRVSPPGCAVRASLCRVRHCKSMVDISWPVTERPARAIYAMPCAHSSCLTTSATLCAYLVLGYVNKGKVSRGDLVCDAELADRPLQCTVPLSDRVVGGRRCRWRKNGCQKQDSQ